MSIFLRYDPVPIILSEPFERNDSRDENGDLVIVNFPNRWAKDTTSIASSGWIALAAESGILLNTPGYVDTSGIRTNTIYAQTYSKIDSSGNFLDFYSGTNSGIVFKLDNNNLSASNYYLYDSSINRLTIPTAPTGKLLYISNGLEEGFTIDINSPKKAISPYNYIDLIPKLEIDGQGFPSKITINSDELAINSELTIAPNLDGYQGRILTHMGSGNPVAWKEPNFLPAGIEYYKYLKRPVLIDQNRIIFYTTQPSWVPDSDWSEFSLEILQTEFGIADTIELENNEAEIKYIKFADSITFLTYDLPQNIDNVAFEDIVSQIDFTDPLTNQELSGFAITYCPGEVFELTGDETYPFIGYARSIKKGNYLTMVLASGQATKESFSCDPEDDSGKFTFRPSTSNTISTRPETYTSFNQMAEDIDFIIYGKKNILYDNYDPSIFELNSNSIPVALSPSFKVDANIPNSVSGSPSSGVYFTKYLDREKLQPSGWGYDDSGKVMINTSGAYVIASIPSGSESLETHANLTVSGTTYSDYFIAREIYLKPEPLEDGSSEYIANAILTLDSKGRIISQKPQANPTRSNSPSNLSAIKIGSSDVSLIWTAPTDNGGSDIVAYIIQFSANGGSEWTTLPNGLLINRLTPTATSATISNLSFGTSYIFRVAAQNNVGISDYSNPSNGITVNTSVPERPQNFTAQRFFEELEIHLGWSAGHNGTSPIVGYLIEESTDGGANWVYYNQPENLITETSIIIDNANSAISYNYRISAKNDSGFSSYSYVNADNNLDPPIIPDPTQSNWDFGRVLFTGVCS